MIPRELLKKIRKIEIHTSRLVNNHMAGQYHSVFKGRGIAFSEVRQYFPGDDIRVIDWNVSARMNEPYIKVFSEERDRTVNLLIDMSASGVFGSQALAKREVAAEIAAVIAFSAISNNDRVGLIIFTDHVERYVPPQKGKKHVLRVISEILRFKPASRATNIGTGIEFLTKVCRRRSVAFVVSDFLATGWDDPLRIANRRHDMIPVIVSDPLEHALPPAGLVQLEDVETGQLLEFDSSGPQAQEFARCAANLRSQREEILRRLKIDFVNVSTDASHVDALVAFFRMRAKRKERA